MIAVYTTPEVVNKPRRRKASCGNIGLERRYNVPTVSVIQSRVPLMQADAPPAGCFMSSRHARHRLQSSTKMPTAVTFILFYSLFSHALGMQMVPSQPAQKRYS